MFRSRKRRYTNHGVSDSKPHRNSARHLPQSVSPLRRRKAFHIRVKRLDKKEGGRNALGWAKKADLRSTTVIASRLSSSRSAFSRLPPVRFRRTGGAISWSPIAFCHLMEVSRSARDVGNPMRVVFDPVGYHVSNAVLTLQRACHNH